ncbi:hypothetical protein VTO58DRAFT_104302 [Aureobasidium pullulans]
MRWLWLAVGVSAGLVGVGDFPSNHGRALSVSNCGAVAFLSHRQDDPRFYKKPRYQCSSPNQNAPIRSAA